MSVLVYWKDDRDPSLTDQLTSDGEPVDLTVTGLTARFKMRGPIGGPTADDLKVDQPVSNKDAQGNWRYDWQVDDLDTPGTYLAWLEVTVSSKTQTLWEMMIEVREHAARRNYAELEIVRNSLGVSDSYLDPNIQSHIAAASRAIDNACGRRFWLDTDAAQVRYYSASSYKLLHVDDVVSVTALAVDRTGVGSFSESWVLDTDFVLEPANPVEGWPYEWVRRRYAGGRDFPCHIERSIRVTGQFGWPSIPSPIMEATQILAVKLLKRIREAPFGVVVPGVDMAFRIARTDPDIAALIGPYIRKPPFAVGA